MLLKDREGIKHVIERRRGNKCMLLGDGKGTKAFYLRMERE